MYSRQVGHQYNAENFSSIFKLVNEFEVFESELRELFENIFVLF